jgi:polyphosphate kinase
MHHFVREQYRCWNDELLPGLAKHQIRVLTVDSADWMPRNLYERVEVLFPLKDPSLRERISKEILSSYLADNRKARLLGPDGQYTHVRAAGTASPFPSRNI